MLAPAAAPAAITPGQTLDLKRWFLRYAAKKVRQHPRHREGVGLKVTHSIRVARFCAAIGADLGLTAERLRLARTIGLLHDVARFEQLIRYDTFVDRVSVDHGDLGADILREEPLVNALAVDDRTILLHAVRHHNDAAIPGANDEGVSYYLKLVRDADKLDIYRVLCSIWLKPNPSEPASGALNLEAGSQVSPEIATAIQAHRLAPMGAVRTRADLLLVRLAWVFDLNFPPTCKCLARLGYLPRLMQALPDTREIADLLAIINAYVAGQNSSAVN